MTFDFQGDLVSVVQVIALILLVVGVYPYRVRTKNRNLIMHGFFSIMAIGLNLATVLSVMIPAFSGNLVSIINLSLVQSAVVWLHAVLGVIAIVLGLIIIVSWGDASSWRIGVFKNVETDDSYFCYLGFCVSAGTRNTFLQHNIT